MIKVQENQSDGLKYEARWVPDSDVDRSIDAGDPDNPPKVFDDDPVVAILLCAAALYTRDRRSPILEGVVAGCIRHVQRGDSWPPPIPPESTERKAYEIYENGGSKRGIVVEVKDDNGETTYDAWSKWRAEEIRGFKSYAEAAAAVVEDPPHVRDLP